MHIWVTRPPEDAKILRARLIAQGHEVFAEPLLTIEYDKEEPLELDDAQATIATSKNALRAIAEREDCQVCKQLPLYAVGKGTASVARALGFENVIEGPARARELLQVITDHAQINDGALVHLSGADVAFPLAEELSRLGYSVFQPIVYHAKISDRLSDNLLNKLVLGQIQGVILLSPRTAEAFVNLARAHQIYRSVRQLTYFCLSEAISKKLSVLQPIDVKLSFAPNIEDLLAVTGDLAAK